MIRLSIVMPTLNGEAFLQKAIESTRQSIPYGLELEYIVVDGGSVDQTLPIVNAYPHIRLIEDKGTGPANAQNIGLFAATGDYVLFLMSDDLLAADALREFHACATARPDVMIWTGGIDFFSTDSKGNVLAHSHLPSPLDGRLELKPILYGSPMLPSRFFKRSLFDAMGAFDERYQFSNDRELMARLYFSACQSGSLASTICRFRIHAGSRTMGGDVENTISYIKEHLEWSWHIFTHTKKNLPESCMIICWMFYEVLRLVRYKLALFLRI